MPPCVPRGCPNGQGLPKSNLAQEGDIRADISSGGAGPGTPFDRRAIPAGASEGIWHAADGHSIRRIDWKGAGKRGSILFMPGRGDSYEKYLEALDHWAHQGWTVTAADWRGQGGSGRLGLDGVTGHIGDFSVWIDDLAAFWTQWIVQTPAPHVLIGHSMGGHLALRAAVEGRVRPDALVLSAPMLGFTPIGLPSFLLHQVAKLMCRIGDPRRPAWKWSEKPGQPPENRIKLLTHDPDRYADELWWREHRPELVMGPGSWGWIERAYASMRQLARPGVLEGLDVPTLIVATSADGLVDGQAAREASERLPRGELLLFGREARHEILRESDPVRAKAMATIDAFLSRAAPRVEA